MKQNVLITGVAGNLGSAIARVLLDRGYEVFGTVEPGKNSGAPVGVTILEVDLGDEGGADACIKQIKTKIERLDAAVLTVGGFAMGNINNTSSDDLLSMYRLNFLTAYHVVKPVYQWMKDTGGGRMVLIGAKPALEGGASEVMAYALSKGSVVQLAEILNEKSNEDGIVASVIVPSIIDTPQNREAMPGASFEHWVKPETIGEQVAHLLSPAGAALRNPVMRIYNRA